jgi:hypothetical protein
MASPVLLVSRDTRARSRLLWGQARDVRNCARQICAESTEQRERIRDNMRRLLLDRLTRRAEAESA